MFDVEVSMPQIESNVKRLRKISLTKESIDLAAKLKKFKEFRERKRVSLALIGEWLKSKEKAKKASKRLSRAT